MASTDHFRRGLLAQMDRAANGGQIDVLINCGQLYPAARFEKQRGRQLRRPRAFSINWWIRTRLAAMPRCAMTLQEEDRGRLVDVPGYGKRIERNFSGSAACHRRQLGLAQLSRSDGSSLAIGGRFDVIGHVYLLLFDGGTIHIIYAEETRRGMDGLP